MGRRKGERGEGLGIDRRDEVSRVGREDYLDSREREEGIRDMRRDEMIEDDMRYFVMFV